MTVTLDPALFIARAASSYPKIAHDEFPPVLFAYSFAANEPAIVNETPDTFFVELNRLFKVRELDVVAFESHLFDEAEVCVMAKSTYVNLRSGNIVDDTLSIFMESSHVNHLTNIDALLR